MKDKFTEKAFSQGYLARSIYKLTDIQKKYRIIKKGNKVLDLGAAPGSWSQYAKNLGAEVTAIDINLIKANGIKKIKLDIFNNLVFNILEKYDVVLSDLAPNTTGIKKLDNERSYNLTKRALEIAKKTLKPNGKFLCKIFQSELSGDLRKEIKKEFKLVKTIKPLASKKRSKEIYFLAMKRIKNL